MSTLSDLRTNIADDINRSDLSTQIDKAINRAIRFYRRDRFWFQETSGTFATVASQQAYSTADGIPSDIAEIDYVKITYQSNWIVELDPVTLQEVQNLNIGNYTGKPEKYAFYQQKFYLWPIPDAAYTVTVFYTKNYSDLSSGSDSNDYTNYAQELIENRARWWLNMRIIKDMEGAKGDKEMEIESLNALRAESERYISSGQITATSW